MPEELRTRVERAVAHFWRTRSKQGLRQGDKSGRKDAGSRAAVTGGKQLDGFVALVRELVVETGVDPTAICVERRRTILPGYFRATKEWDIVVASSSSLVAVIEVKSQIGPSFGNNFNNRTEEAVGSAHDLWTAYREGAFAESPRPWLGYLMLLEDCRSSSEPVKVDEPHFPVFPEFKPASYAKRYEILCRRLVRERLYDSACLLLSESSKGRTGAHRTPAEDLSFERFADSCTGMFEGHYASENLTRRAALRRWGVGRRGGRGRGRPAGQWRWTRSRRPGAIGA